MTADISVLLERLCYRYPSPLVDAVTEHEPGRRVVAIKNVTVNEEFFQGHFPGAPLLPAVLMLESLTQVAAILLLQGTPPTGAPPGARVYLRGVNDAKFRRQVVPGDRLRLEITLGRRRSSLARAQVAAYVGDQIAAEAELLLGLVADGTEIHPTAIVHPRAYIGHGTVEDFANISAGSAVHQFCRVGRHAFIGGYSVVTKDALPFARTVGSRPARIFGINSIGLMRRGLPAHVIEKLKRTFRYLTQSKL